MNGHKLILIPIKDEHIEHLRIAASKDDRAVRHWVRRAVEERLALLGYIDEPGN